MSVTGRCVQLHDFGGFCWKRMSSAQIKRTKQSTFTTKVMNNPVLSVCNCSTLVSIIVLITIEDRYFSCTGCNDVNAGIVTISVSPVCLWVGDKLGWKARRVLASDWPFSIAFCSYIYIYCSLYYQDWAFIVQTFDKNNKNRKTENNLWFCYLPVSYFNSIFSIHWGPSYHFQVRESLVSLYTGWSVHLCSDIQMYVLKA